MARWVVPTAVVLAVALLISLFFASSSSSAINSDKGSTALLIIDVQNCFMSGGTLAVAGADAVIPIINALRQDNQFDVVVATKDWHCPDHVSFASQHPGCKIYDAVNLTYLQNGKCAAWEFCSIFVWLNLPGIWKTYAGCIKVAVQFVIVSRSY
jgi:hypothetical protein